MMDVEEALVRAISGAGDSRTETQLAMLDALFYIRRYRWANRNHLRLRTRKGGYRHV